ncbi:MAG TPA: SDR family oxidoreductase [Alphaproteobacteria bacterium]|nr:SDR family oxidoreductase [Alphaproteobacteria bacterium]
MIDSLIKIYRRGGYATFNISYISNGSLLRGKRVLVTGGSSGIGFCIAQKCIQQGAKVVITGRDASKLEAAAQRINHPFCKTLVWDVGRTADIEKGVKESVSLLGGRVDILVNNAGIVNGVDFPDVPEEMWDQIYAVNSKGVFFVTQAICKLWLREGSAETRKVLNISSQGGFVGATYPYRMTKWDIVGLTQGLGVKLAPHGIIVNGIAPGIVATAMQPSILTEQANIFHHLNPLQRYALPQEIAELALFLLTDLSNFIVGQTIVCDGGFSLK